MDLVLSVFSDFRGHNNQKRAIAESRINEFHSQPGFSSVLLQIFLNNEFDIQTRQLAGVNLNILCRHHWSSIDEKFKSPELSPAEKEELKQHIPSALNDPSNHIRTTAGSVISMMASWDWPTKWNGLVENLAACLESDDLNLVHGCLKCLDMLCSSRNLTDQHIPQFVTFVFPQLERVFSEERYPERIRMRAVRILFSIVSWLGMVKAVYPQSTAKALKPVLPLWYRLFSNELKKPDVFGAGHGSKIGALQTLSKLIDEFPEFIKNDLVPLLDCLWNCLISSVEIWERVAVFSTEKDQSGYDSDAGDEIGFKSYLCMVVEVISAISEKKRFQSMLSASLLDLSYYIIRLMQLTDEQVELFELEPSDFLIEESENDPSVFSIRTQSAKLMQIIAKAEDGCGIEAINMAVVRHMQELAAMESSGGTDVKDSPMWWKRREAVLYAVGTSLKFWNDCREDLGNGGNPTEPLRSDEVRFDVQGIIPLLVNDCQSNNMLLRGRSLWCASHTIQMLSSSVEILAQENRPETTDPQIQFFVDCAVQAMMTQGAPLPYQLHASTCVTQLSPFMDEVALRNTVADVLPILASVAPELEESALCSLLETLEEWISLDSDVTFSHCEPVLDNILEAWSRNSKDPWVQGLVSSCIQAVCKVQKALPIAQQKVGVVLHAIFSDLGARDNGLIEAATDILGHLVIDAPWPLPHDLLEFIIPTIFSQLYYTIDNSMIISGCTSLVAVVRCAKENLDTWQTSVVIPNFDTGEHQEIKGTALDIILHIVERILSDPQLSENSCINVGALITKLIDTVGSIMGNRTFNILQLAVTKLANAEMSSVRQEFLQVFAQLVRQNVDLVLQFLCEFTFPSGETALQFVLSLWTRTFGDRHSAYQMKVSLLALTQLFGHPDLSGVMVPSDTAIEEDIATGLQEAIGSRTRSKLKEKPQSGPRLEELNVRIFRLLLREHMWLIEEQQDNPDYDSANDDLADDEQDMADDPGLSEYLYAPASQYEASGVLDEELYKGTINLDQHWDNSQYPDDEETDPDILQDPAFDLDREEFIYNWMKQLATDNPQLFDSCVSHLSAREKEHLIGTLIPSRGENTQQ